MANTYAVGLFPGERPQKTITRAFLYSIALRRHGLSEFRARHHVVLGGLGGDVRALLHLGVPAENIHVAETNRRTFLRLRREFPSVDVRHENVLLTVCRLSCCPAVLVETLNLDFCGKLDDALIATVAGCIKLLQRSLIYTSIFVTIFGAREQGKEILTRIDSVKKNGIRNFWPTSSKTSSHLRCEALYECLLGVGASTGRHPLYRGSYVSYVSSGASLKGKNAHCPMGAAFFYIRRMGKAHDSLNRLVRAEDLSSRELAFLLRKEGLNAPEISALLNEPRQRVAGWFSVRTKTAQLG